MNHDPAVAESVVDGVWRLRSVPGANSYLAELDDGQHILVDAGTPPAGPIILERLAQLEVVPTALLLTHRHFDHAGSGAELREALGLRVLLGVGDVEDGRVRRDRRPPQLVRRLMGRSGGARLAIDEPLSMDSEVEVLPGVLAIPAPGHTDGSIVFELTDRDLMFVGDLTLNSGDRLSRPLSMANDDTALQEASLAAIAARATAHGAPGHGDPLTEVFGDWIRKLSSMPPAPGGSLLRVLRNPRSALRFARRMRG